MRSGRVKRVRGKRRCVKPTRQLVRMKAKRCTRLRAAGRLRRDFHLDEVLEESLNRIGVRRFTGGNRLVEGDGDRCRGIDVSFFNDEDDPITELAAQRQR